MAEFLITVELLMALVPVLGLVALDLEGSDLEALSLEFLLLLCGWVAS